MFAFSGTCDSCSLILILSFRTCIVALYFFLLIDFVLSVCTHCIRRLRCSCLQLSLRIKTSLCPIYCLWNYHFVVLPESLSRFKERSRNRRKAARIRTAQTSSRPQHRKNNHIFCRWKLLKLNGHAPTWESNATWVNTPGMRIASYVMIWL